MAKLTSDGLSILKLILRELQAEEIKAIEKEPEIDFTPSVEYRSKIKALISGLSNKGENKVFGWKKIIVIITAVTIILALAITAIALREKIADFFETETDGGIRLNLPEESPGSKEGYYLLVSIPDGFEKSYFNADKRRIITEWSRGDELICFEQRLMSTGDQIDFDTESEDYRKEKIGEYTVYYTYKYSTHFTVWKNDKYVFFLDCESDVLTWEEIKNLIFTMKLEPFPEV